MQLEAAECGAASLAMVLGWFGRRIPLEQLRIECGVSRDGAKASAILAVARRHGLSARGVRAELEHVVDLPTPFIAFVDFNHFLVVEGADGDRVHLNDPAFGHRTVSLDDFDEMFTGVALTFDTTDEFEPVDLTTSTARALWRRFAPSRPTLLAVLVLGVLLVGPGLLVPELSRRFVDEVLIAGDTNPVLPLALGLAFAATLRFTLVMAQSSLLTNVEMRTGERGSEELLEHLLRLPLPFFSNRYAGELAGRIALTDRLSAVVTGELASAVLDGLAAVFFLAVLIAYDGYVALAVLVIATSNVIVLGLTMRRLSEGHRRRAVDQGRLDGVSISGLQDVESLKAAGAEHTFFARWAGLHARVTNSTQQLTSDQVQASSFPTLVASLITIAVLGLGGWRVIDGAITVGTLVAMQSLAVSFSAPIAAITTRVASVQDVRSHVERIEDLLGQQPTVREMAPAPRPADAALVQLDDVSFGYQPLEAPLIDGLCLTITAGSMVSLIGPTGSGKSTVGRLIAGLLTPDDGAVLLRGRPVDDWAPEDRAGMLAHVDQDVMLFDGTLRDNLTLWDDTVPDEPLVRAVTDAMIHDLVARRPSGFDTRVDEGGANFSGGEAQRVEIARALVGDPAVVVLDEATSALDPTTEAELMRRLRRRGGAIVVVAHRLSTIRDSDEIIVFDRGRPVERGTHDDLVARGGRYVELIGQGADG